MNVLMEVITAMTMLIVKILKGTIHVVANQVLAEMAFLVHVRNRFPFNFHAIGQDKIWLYINSYISYTRVWFYI